MALQINKSMAKVCRHICSRNASVLSTALQYFEYGEPKTVIKKVDENLSEPKDTEIIVKMIAAPINPADINTIQGKYPDKPSLPAIAGNEGVGEVIECGPAVKNIKPGDRVVPFINLLGTWRTHALIKEELLVKVPKDLGIVEAATLTVNPPSAYRMLADYVNLKPNDVVIQNGANSAVGQNVAQICKIKGFKCIGIVRDRPDLDTLIEFLKKMGCAEVLTEEQLRTTTIFKTKQYAKPKLALNCVGGKSSTEILRHLDAKGVLVTYGAMSREPVIAPNAALIFKDISFRGFWMSRWNREHYHDEKRFAMVEDIIDWHLKGLMKGPVHKMIPFKHYQEALTNALDIRGFASGKTILDFRTNESCT